jgi:hypothetical protein
MSNCTSHLRNCQSVRVNRKLLISPTVDLNEELPHVVCESLARDGLNHLPCCRGFLFDFPGHALVTLSRRHGLWVGLYGLHEKKYQAGCSCHSRRSAEALTLGNQPDSWRSGCSAMVEQKMCHER